MPVTSYPAAASLIAWVPWPHPMSSTRTGRAASTGGRHRRSWRETSSWRTTSRTVPRRVFLVATALVGIAGVVGAPAPNLPVLIVALVILGFGACAGYPAAMWLIRSEATRTGTASPAEGVDRQADSDRIGTSAGLLRTVFYIGAIVAGAAQGNFLSAADPTTGLHRLALFMLVVAALFLLVTVVDKPLHRLGSRREPETAAPPDR